MNEILKPAIPQYWCAYSDDLSVFHIGKVNTDGQLKTGQPNLEHFDTEAELEETVDRLMGEGYYASRIEPDIDPHGDK